jgi:quercetin dioxygenase-like cupin family protein
MEGDLLMEVGARTVSQARVEVIRSGQGDTVLISPGVRLREFAGKACGAEGFSTGTASFDIGATLPYHTHPISEAITILSGTARIAVEGRRYVLNPFDCIHVPPRVAHEAHNCSVGTPLLVLSAFASAEPFRDLVDYHFVVHEKGLAKPSPEDPESIIRFAEATVYELSEGAEFRDLFAGRFGSLGICGGYGRFRPNASLPCHVHQYDESITIIEGEAISLVQGNRYHLAGYDTAIVPQGRPHRFLNHSAGPMAMLWVYAGSEPERTLVDSRYCNGSLVWPGA